MKKVLIIVLGLVCAGGGYVAGARPWKALDFSTTTVLASKTLLDLVDLGHFGVSEPPQFSSEQYYFKSGFTDVEEYWSFVLPPEYARAFLDNYTSERQLTSLTDKAAIPEVAYGNRTNPDWREEFWFPSSDVLDEIYLSEWMFCGYARAQNRIYLANWDM